MNFNPWFVSLTLQITISLVKKIAGLWKDFTITLWNLSKVPSYITILTFERFSIRPKSIIYSTFHSSFVLIEEGLKFHYLNLESTPKIETIHLNEIRLSKNQFKIKEVIDIISLKAFLIVSEHFDLIVYDYFHQRIRMEVKLSLSNPIFMCFSDKYSTIAFIDNSLSISIIQLEKVNEFYELNHIGRLVGHSEKITCGCLIQPDDHLITGDISLTIKIWSILRMNSIHTFTIHAVDRMERMIFIPKLDSILIVSKKLNLIPLQRRNFTKNSRIDDIVDILFDKKRARFLIFRQSCVLFISALTGHVSKIKSYKLKDKKIREKFTASQFIPFSKFSKFYTCDFNGNIFLTDPVKVTNAKITQHKTRIFGLYQDVPNCIILTISRSEMMAHQMNNSWTKEQEVIKKLSKMNFDSMSELTHIFQKRMNAVLLANQNKITCIDYSTFKIDSVINFENNCEILSIHSDNEYGLVYVLTSSNNLYVLTFLPKSKLIDNHFRIEILQIVDLAEFGQISLGCLLKSKKRPKHDSFEYVFSTKKNQLFKVSFCKNFSEKFDLNLFEKPAEIDHFQKKLNNFELEIKFAKNLFINSSKNQLCVEKNDMKSFENLDLKVEFKIQLLHTFFEEIEKITFFWQNEFFICVITSQAKIYAISLKCGIVFNLNLNYIIPITWNFEFDLKNNFKRFFEAGFEYMIKTPKFAHLINKVEDNDIQLKKNKNVIFVTSNEQNQFLKSNFKKRVTLKNNDNCQTTLKLKKVERISNNIHDLEVEEMRNKLEKVCFQKKDFGFLKMKEKKNGLQNQTTKIDKKENISMGGINETPNQLIYLKKNEKSKSNFIKIRDALFHTKFEKMDDFINVMANPNEFEESKKIIPKQSILLEQNRFPNILKGGISERKFDLKCKQENGQLKSYRNLKLLPNVNLEQNSARIETKEGFSVGKLISFLKQKQKKNNIKS